MENVIHNYTGYGTQGENYKPHQDIKEIAKIVKSTLKKEFPDCNFSVQIERYSGGQSLNISLMSAPWEAIINTGSIIDRKFVSTSEQGYEFKKHTQLNQYQFNNPYEGQTACADGIPEGWNNGAILTREAWNCMERAYKIASGYNYDDSDGMIDYFNTNFYLHLNIGKWDNPFQRKGGKS
uniref:Large polyvalent protein associated domain-containing protein n=1 Tax=viral metagenome TaxID=1070528 RepID=A0A6M3XYU9_9ZZZZ